MRKLLGLFLILVGFSSLAQGQQIIRGIGPNGQPVPVAVDSNGNVIISNNGACNVGPGTPTCTPTTSPTSTPTPNWTTSPTPTPQGISFNITTASSSPQTLVAANAGYYNNLHGFSVDNTNSSSAGAVYISDGTVTLWGPITLLSQVGVSKSLPVYSAAMNRPLIFFNPSGVANMEITGQYSIDLPGVK